MCSRLQASQSACGQAPFKVLAMHVLRCIVTHRTSHTPFTIIRVPCGRVLLVDVFVGYVLGACGGVDTVRLAQTLGGGR